MASDNERLLIYQARQAVYALLRWLYEDKPTPEQYAWLSDERPFMAEAFPIALEGEAATALQQADQGALDVTYEALCQDYIRLYIGPGRMEVPPWESVYRNDERRLFDSHTLHVRETYARHGMEFVKKNKTPEDHIGIELEFMQILTERLLKTLESGDTQAEQILLEEQLEFLKRHMLVWVPLFKKLTLKSAQTDFYAGLAGVLVGFLEWESGMLEQLLDAMDSG